MPRNPKELGNAQERLRAIAEDRLSQVTKIEEEPISAQKLLHELQVYQIELEMQNEELRRSQTALEESRDRYLDLYEFAPVGYITLSLDGLIKEINLTGVSLFGVERKQMLRRRFSSFVALEDRDRWYRQFLSILKHEKRQACELLLIRSDQTSFQASLDCLHLSNGPNPVVRVTVNDVSEQKKAREDLRIAAIAFESQEAMIVIDTHANILRVNRAFSQLTGYSTEETVGRTPMLLQSGRHDQSFFQHQQSELREKKFWQGEMWNRRKNGKIYAEWVTISAVTDIEDRVTHYVYTFSDISINREAEAEIHRLAYYDALTQLPNRRMVLDRIEQAQSMSSRNGTYGALMFLDLDNFKTLNDTQGHDVGDQVLVEVAQRLHNTLRESDTISRAGSTISRLGGDEFVVVLENLSDQDTEAAIQARHVAEKLHEAISHPYALPSGELICTTSIGITLFHKRELPVNKLLKQADLSLYQAKKSGGNSLHFFNPSMQSEIDRRKAQENDLSEALTHKQFQFYYQALTDNRQRIIGAEALLRWIHPKMGLQSPKDFFPLAEETGLIMPISQWVLENACAQIKKWESQKNSRHLHLSVNVSSRQFRHPGFVSAVKNALAGNDTDPSRLVLDLSEELVSNNIEKTITIMHEIKKLGVCFSLDGFGTGLSSLGYLRRLPLDRLKIDASMLQDPLLGPTNAVIVESIINIAKILGLGITAQGIEAEEQRNFFMVHGCDAYQGFLISHPLPLAEFDQFLDLKTVHERVNQNN
ncbi:MAG: sensor domain-containing protein [Leptospirales bacterium]